MMEHKLYISDIGRLVLNLGDEDGIARLVYDSEEEANKDISSEE